MTGSTAPRHERLLQEDAVTTPGGCFVEMDGESYYRIAGFHRLDPFLMSLPSDTDLWMFAASSGGLTCGRVDANGSLFPYRTADQLYQDHHHTGPLTLVRVGDGDGDPVLWQPFDERRDDDPALERNLYKNVVGNRLVFEEIDHDLGLSFRYRWTACDEFGWVRTATLHNLGDRRLWIDLLDGLRNILPHGAPLGLYQQASNLVDAYKTSEVDPETGLGVFALTAGITDRAEALEVLRANTVWCLGLSGGRVHLGQDAERAFRQGRVLTEDTVLHGVRGNYLVSDSRDLGPDDSLVWHMIGDTGRDHVQIAELRRLIRENDGLGERIAQGVSLARENLRRNVASADGVQTTGRPESWAHHFANVLFNNMRGGVFDANHKVPVADFDRFLQTRNADVARRTADLLSEMPETIEVRELRTLCHKSGDADLSRLGHEYLPLHFGRRHGDPSRPWNHFAIRVRNDEGERELRYEGNWRDIFQNWEALATAFPGFLPAMVSTFVNASTVDGFNPYRITREGVDWETESDDDPWSNIGYWGDHQIVYLLRLLEMLDNHDPDALISMLGESIFSYADVPYRLKPYAEILADPSATISFDTEKAARIEERADDLGGDGKLLRNPDGSVRHANLLEKLLVPVLSKLSNLVPDAGIWMNTQRPEWNDANNVLAGGGVSVVTLCHLRRMLSFMERLVSEADETALPVSTGVARWFDAVSSILESERDLLKSTDLGTDERKRVMDALGQAFCSYRAEAYDQGLSGAEPVALSRVAEVCRTAREWADWGIAANRRDDGLYHSYNLLEITDDGVAVNHLQEMLEGQVAVLSSGLPDAEDALAILEGLFDSAMYRPDQRSFLLYPAAELPGFLGRNIVPDAAVDIPLVRDLLADDDSTLIDRDADDRIRFQGDLQNVGDLDAALDRLGRRPEWRDAVDHDRAAVLELFESVFRHKSYMGRSGIMYAYEGQGSIYWHMVAKLLLAVQEIVLDEDRNGASDEIQSRLVSMYFRIRAGIGYEKTAAEYGAFPTDPYSHTPPGRGAKQPGTTGQVKEEVLTRLGELGVRIELGTVRFMPAMLSEDEFLQEPSTLDCYDIEGGPLQVAIPAQGLGFTLCQTPVIYELTDGHTGIRVTLDDGSVIERPGNRLDAQLSNDLFDRNGRIDRIHVGIPRDLLVDKPGVSAI